MTTATAWALTTPQYLVDMWQLALDAQNEGWGMKPGEETAVTAFDSMVTDAWSPPAELQRAAGLP